MCVERNILNALRPEEKPVSTIIISLPDKIRIVFDENISEEILRRILKASEVLND